MPEKPGGKPDWKPAKYSMICSLHFRKENAQINDNILLFIEIQNQNLQCLKGYKIKIK
jgi:hypothetical protein